jgi:uncharacterized protein
LRSLGAATSVVLVGLAAYAAVALLVWAFQERLIFYPQSPHGEPAPPPGWSLEHVDFTPPGGTRLVGVLVKPPLQRPPVVVYFGGNAEEVTSYATEAAQAYGERAVLLLNYRGYGASEGVPGERELVADGVGALEWVRARHDVDGTRIALHGRSLGTGVAVQVAARSAPRCVVLTSPFDSARDVAKGVYPWLPVAWLLRHPFDSIAHAPRLTMPVLVLAGEADTLIGPHHSRRLAAAWGGPARFVSLPGMGHNDLSVHPQYAPAIREFLDAHL